MVAYSFKRRFVEPIESGRKRQTIRNERKRHARPGEEVQLYTAMRTKQCRLIARATCFSVRPIRLDFLLPAIIFSDQVAIVSRESRNSFAARDGFEDWADLVAFWMAEHGKPGVFSGVLIEWTPPK